MRVFRNNLCDTNTGPAGGTFGMFGQESQPCFVVPQIFVKNGVCFSFSLFVDSLCFVTPAKEVISIRLRKYL